MQLSPRTGAGGLPALPGHLIDRALDKRTTPEYGLNRSVQLHHEATQVLTQTTEGLSICFFLHVIDIITCRTTGVQRKMLGLGEIWMSGVYGGFAGGGFLTAFCYCLNCSVWKRAINVAYGLSFAVLSDVNPIFPRPNAFARFYVDSAETPSRPFFSTNNLSLPLLYEIITPSSGSGAAIAARRNTGLHSRDRDPRMPRTDTVPNSPVATEDLHGKSKNSAR